MRALFTQVIADGMRGRSFAVRDPKIAALAILGSCNWLHEWYRPRGRLSPDAIGDELAERAVKSVQV